MNLFFIAAICLAVIVARRDLATLKMFVVGNMVLISFLAINPVGRDFTAILYAFIVSSQFMILKSRGKTEVLRMIVRVFIAQLYFSAAFYVAYPSSSLSRNNLLVLTSSMFAFAMSQYAVMACLPRIKPVQMWMAYLVSVSIAQLVDSVIFYTLVFGSLRRCLDGMALKLCINVSLFPLALIGCNRFREVK